MSDLIFIFIFGKEKIAQKPEAIAKLLAKRATVTKRLYSVGFIEHLAGQLVGSMDNEHR
ncbi:7214_t:CDS:2 [Entrophospora sp. SA101]|nr:7214_t:CDS:2 [Entrophospora sp. SA101]